MKTYYLTLSKVFTSTHAKAGNSIVVDVLYHIFRKMFIEPENETQQLTLF